MSEKKGVRPRIEVLGKEVEVDDVLGEQERRNQEFSDKADDAKREYTEMLERIERPDVRQLKRIADALEKISQMLHLRYKDL